MQQTEQVKFTWEQCRENPDEIVITGLEDENTPGYIVIPATIEDRPVTTIGDGAFSGCSGLTSVVIPDSVTSIGYWAYWGCSGLTIYGKVRSEAEKYANNNNIRFAAQ